MRTTIVLLAASVVFVACAPRRTYYTVCPIKVPNALEVVPKGGLQYRRLERGVYGCNNATCAIPAKDWRTVNENMAKCEKARSGLASIIEAVNVPTQITDEGMQIREEDVELPKELNVVPIVDPRKP